jgi:peroxiredoxin (alkyl hydroperoxide reductase subunit C)
MTNGRNIDEILRLLTALQTSDKEKVVTPANWVPGQPVIVPPPNNYAELMKRINNPAMNCVSWYLCYKK